MTRQSLRLLLLQEYCRRISRAVLRRQGSVSPTETPELVHAPQPDDDDNEEALTQAVEPQLAFSSQAYPHNLDEYGRLIQAFGKAQLRRFLDIGVCYSAAVTAVLISFRLNRVCVCCCCDRRMRDKA